MASNIVTASVPMPETGAGAPPKADPVAVAAAGNKPNPGAAPAPASVEGLPEGFNSVAELTAAYEKLKGAPEGEPAAGDPPKPSEKLPEPSGDAKAEDAKGDDKKPAEGDEPKGDPKGEGGEDFDPTPYYQEYAERGEVSPESISAIAKKTGLSEKLIRDHIGYRAQAVEAQKAKLFAVAGGEEAFNAQVAWASKSWDGYSVFHKAATSGDFATASMAMGSLKAAYEAAEGKEPNLVSGGSQGGNGGGLAPFKSRAEQSAAMKDPRYRTDAGYRASVVARSKGLK